MKNKSQMISDMAVNQNRVKTQLSSESVKNIISKNFECKPTLICHLRRGLLSSLFVTHVIRKVHFEPLKGIFGKNWKK